MNADRIAKIEAGLLFPRGMVRLRGLSAAELRERGFPIAAFVRTVRESPHMRLDMKTRYGRVTL